MFARLWKVFALMLAMVAMAPGAYAGDAASDFTLRDVTGKTVSLSDYKGKVIILSFWATWCQPCKEEMPHLDKMYKELGDEGLQVLSVSFDDARMRSKVISYVRQRGFSFPVVMDPDSKAIGMYNPSKTAPWTVIIDRNFEVAQIHSGFQPGDEEKLREEVVELLAH